jgi:hypothetical protein
VRNCDGVEIHDNDIESYDGNVVNFSQMTNPKLEYNRLHEFGRADYNMDDGEHGLQISQTSGARVRYNVFYNHEPTDNASAGYGIWQKRESVDNIYANNILYRCGMRIELDQYWDDNVQAIQVTNNLFAGMKEYVKTSSDGTLNANLSVDLVFWTDGGVVSTASNGGSPAKAVFTVGELHGIVNGDQIDINDNTESDYNILHTVTGVSGNEITVALDYVSAGTGGTWRFAGTSAAKSSGQDGTLNGEVSITDNNFWRFENSTPAQVEIETGAHLVVNIEPTPDFFAVGDTLAGFTDNDDERPDWVGDPEADDFRLGDNSFAGWFPADMPFTAAMSKAWSPD